MLEQLQKDIRNRVFESSEKVPVRDLVMRIAREAGVSKNLVKKAVDELVGTGELQYTYLHGTSFLEQSFARPVRVSKRVILKPPDKAYRPKPGEVVVVLTGGAAFGNGAHPTTCLALEALDTALGDITPLPAIHILAGLDVGTGTGVLAIAMAKLGVQEVLATDIDPCALAEARNNVSLNTLSERVRISDDPVEKLKGTYGVIMANLAYPTLKRMVTVFPTRMETKGLLVLSGFKASASKDLKNAYTSRGLVAVEESSDRGWVCLAFRKPAIP
jgi:ribosomal protein L11 methyltransferase